MFALETMFGNIDMHLDELFLNFVFTFIRTTYFLNCFDVSLFKFIVIFIIVQSVVCVFGFFFVLHV